MQITRLQLQTAIDAGIGTIDATDPEPLGAALRNVGLVVNRVAVGTFYSRSQACGCPLVVAGIVDQDAVPTGFGLQHGFKGGFTHTFDAFIRSLLTPPEFLLDSFVEII